MVIQALTGPGPEWGIWQTCIGNSGSLGPGYPAQG